MKQKGAFARSLNIIIVLAMILSTMTALAIPTEAGQAASDATKGLQSSQVAQDKAGVQADPILDENFDYGDAAGDLTTMSGGLWIPHSAGGTNPIQYVTTGLSFPGYASSDIAGAATFTTTGEDDNQPFEPQSGETLYYAALVNLSSAQTTGDYFMHLKNPGTYYYGRLYAKDSTGVLNFGLGASGAATYSDAPFAYDTTYLTVVKYNMDTGDSSLYVLDSCLPTEPATPVITSTGYTETSIVAIAIRQGNVSNAPAGTVDGIRVANNWADAAACTVPPILEENFDYGETAGDLTTMSGGLWIPHSAGGTNPIQYVTTGLSFPGYASSGLAGAATFGGSGEDDHLVIPDQAEGGDVYFATLVNISLAQTGDYFMHFWNSAFAYPARLFARDSAGALQFGIASGSSGTVYGEANFDYNTTYLVVAKHNQTSGDSTLYVLDSCQLTEPTVPLATAIGAPASPISGIAIRQGNGASAASGTVDGIRVATNWASATACSGEVPGYMTINKTAPDIVDVDEGFDYTLSIGNFIGTVANNVVITDSLPISLTVGNISDGGVLLPGNVVSWTVPSMANGESLDRIVSVFAPPTETTLVNEDYGVWASNWLTRTVGMPVTTNVINSDLITPIADARAAGAGWYGTIQGNVTVVPGTFATRSFAIQDDTGGMYVYPASNVVSPPMVLGDVLRVKGTIKNYNGLLEIDPVESVIWIDTGTVPDPLNVLVTELGPNQGKLVTIEGTALSISGTTNKSITFQDASGTTTVYVYGTTGIDTSVYSFPMPMRVTGMSGAYINPQVNPRYQSDIVDLRPPTVTNTIPPDGATDVSPYKPLEAVFSKAMDAATINTASFLLEDENGLVDGTTGYDNASFTASFTPAAALTPNTEYTATLTSAITDGNGIPLEADYQWMFTTGDADLVPPQITGHFPASDAIDVLLRANVVITFTEDLRPDSLNQEHFILEGPYGAVPNMLSYNPSTFVVTLDPETSLLPTTLFTVTVTGDTTDWAGNPLGADEVWNFTTQVEPPMQVFFGDIHNHTSYSDGSGTPSEALAAGEAAGFDFMAISDHSYAISDFEWEDTLDAVDTATVAGEFIALRGFEYTQGAEGHINVYNTVRHAVRTDTGCTYCDYTPNLEAGVTVEGFYEWAASEGMIGLDTAGTVMQFNHPGWINFNDWAYHPEVSDIARLEEVGNGNGTSYAFSEDQYIRSLDYGWKVGATNNADTHTSYWGINTDHRTGVLMTELTKEALLEALSLRRTFATEDKNFSLTMKANGAWMGSEIANSGQILFEITGDDPDGELTSLVQIITDQGTVAAEYQPGSASFSWEPLLDITTGVHYFYVKVTQADSDRIVSSPVWTLGSEDISITDLVIEPTIPTIYNPSLITVRVTNRNTEARSVTVSLDVNGTPVGTPIVLNVPGNGDGFAIFSWQPTEIGPATITAQISDTPIGDNPDDNSSVLNLTVTDEQLPLILIDASHGNLNATGNEMEMFIKDLSDHRYNVLKNLDELTSDDLNPAVVKLLLITAPQYPYTASELDAISNYMAAGGSLWLVGMSDYPGSVPWAATVADRENAILAAIETQVGSNINMRLNDDEIIDANDNNGYIFGPIWKNFPTEYDTSIGINVEALASWSVASLRGRTPGTPLTADTPDVQIVIQGDLDTGFTVYNTYNDPNHTSNEDADGGGDAYIYNPTWVFPWDTVPEGAIPVPMAAVTQLPGEAGRILLYGDSNDAFTTYAYTAGDGKQNELFNLEAAMWLMGEPLQKSTIAEARAQSVVNQPDNLDKLVWVEGEITAAYGEFFNVLYVQDETGGITVHAPAGDIDPTAYTRGTHVRVVGTVGIYNGDTEIEFFEAEMVQVIDPSTGEPDPLPMTTYEASLEDNQGWLAIITGTVTTKVGNDNIFVDDGSGPVRIFLDGYNGNFDDIQVNDLVSVTGLVSEDGDGQRIRVRNHGMHPEYADDVIKLPQTLSLGIAKTVVTPEMVLPGSLVTYTVVMSNTGTGTVLQAQLTDVLPVGITFGGFISDDGASEQDGTISWSGTVYPEMSINVVFTATVDTNYDLYGETITNQASYTSPYAGSGSDSASFTVANGPEVTIDKSVSVPEIFNPGEAVTYTLSLNNSGDSEALDLVMTDTLPTGLTFGEWILQNGAAESGGVITWNGNLAGEEMFIFTALVDYDASGYGGTITNEVEYTALNTAPGSASASFDIGTPELTIHKTVETASDPAKPGEPITYTVGVHNASATGAVGVHIWDILPDYVEGSDVDLTTNIDAGSAYTVTINAVLAQDVPLEGVIVNTAFYENGELSGEASASFDVWAGAPLLSITKTVEPAGAPLSPGEPITYTIQVSNDGNADALDVHIWDTLPEGVIGDDVNITVTIPMGEAYTITIPATLALDVTRGSTITNTAYYESDGLNGEASASFMVAPVYRMFLPLVKK